MAQHTEAFLHRREKSLLNWLRNRGLEGTLLEPLPALEDPMKNPHMRIDRDLMAIAELALLATVQRSTDESRVQKMARNLWVLCFWGSCSGTYDPENARATRRVIAVFCNP